MTKNRKAIIQKIVNDEDRILLYIDNHPTMPYKVIAPRGFKGNVGDEITYEPQGANFGWLVENKNQKT